jgi:hypothetical protein
VIALSGCVRGFTRWLYSLSGSGSDWGRDSSDIVLLKFGAPMLSWLGVAQDEEGRSSPSGPSPNSPRLR